ncbi:TPA: LysR family transcriptional regulator [Salmonella enterica]|nr:LysR family transcriptional regulator [Salmonella enterica]HAN1802603.1 LysR family transcriptional regulator [Salmonella enterica]
MKAGLIMRHDVMSVLHAFCMIAENHSFTRAAAQLHISTSALSQNMRQLENELGVKLLNRTTRRVGLTEAGHAFLASIRPALNHIDEAMEHARQSRDIPGGALRLTVPRTAATLLLQPNLAGFMRDYPDIRLDIDVNDGFVDLINERFDAGIRFGDAVQLDMNVVPLGDVLRPAIVASPAYLARFGTPLHPQELINHRCLCHRFTRESGLYRWEFVHGAQRLEITPEAALMVNDKALRLSAARDGAGLTYVFEQDVHEDLQDGRLCSVLEEWLPAADRFYLYYPGRAHMAPKLRVFIDYFCHKAILPSQQSHHR